MKLILLYLLLSIIPVTAAFAQTNDSLAYQIQRQKINNLLAQRSDKFSQYTQSLDKHSGLFGWQTKKDIKNSGQILMDIVRTDDNIFKELKILFDYKTFDQTRAQQNTTDYANQLAGYMQTINKLRRQNALLLKQQTEQVAQWQLQQAYWLVALLVFISTSIFLFSRLKKVKAG